MSHMKIFEFDWKYVLYVTIVKH